MFDLRYHVASLAAVFVALIVGILIGVGLSGRGFVSDSERQLLTTRIHDLQRRVADDATRLADLAQRRKLGEAFVARAYPELVRDRLAGKRIAVIFVGPVVSSIRSEILGALTDAGATGIYRQRSLKVPLDEKRLAATIAERPVLSLYDGRQHLGDLGRDFGTQLLLGGRLPLVEAAGPALLTDLPRTDRKPIDGVVLVRTVEPQQGASGQLLTGFYAGVLRAGLPTVGIEASDAAASATRVFRAAGFATVDDIDEQSGRAALVLLLAGGPVGAYGIKPTATDGIIPAVPSAAPASGG